MAFNFGEVFLRETGAAQDRAQSMAEMQLRAKQFADNLAIQEANLALSKRAQTLAEETQKSNVLMEANRLAEQARQFDANLNQRKNEFVDNLNLRKDELGLSQDELNERIRQFDESQKLESNRLKLESKMFYDNLDAEQQRFFAEAGMNREFFYADLEFRRPGEEARTEAIKAETGATLARTDLTRQEIEALKIKSDIDALELRGIKRGIELSELDVDDDIKEYLGIQRNEDGTFPDLPADKAKALLETKLLSNQISRQQAAEKMATYRTQLQNEPFKTEITQENIGDIQSLYPEEARRSKLKTFADQTFNTFVNPANWFDAGPSIDYVAQAFGIDKLGLNFPLLSKAASKITGNEYGSFVGFDFPVSDVGKYYEIQRRTGVDPEYFQNPYGGVESLLGQTLEQSQLSPLQQQYFNTLNEYGAMFADPQTEFTQGFLMNQPPFPAPFAPYANIESLLPPPTTSEEQND